MSAKRVLLVIVTTCLILQIPGSGISVAATEALTSRLGAEFLISLPTPGDQPERYQPVVAYNPAQHEYLVVWKNQRAYSFSELYAQRVSAAGQLLGEFDLTSDLSGDGKPRDQPALAYNATNGEYLLVYVYEVADETDYDIRARRIAWDGSWKGPEIEIFTWANRGFFKPRVAWNPFRNQYLVVADAYDTVSHKYNDVAGRRVIADGTTPYGGHNISSQSQTLQPQAGDVTYNVAADEYMVVWRQNYSGDDWDIWGARVRGDNDAVVTPPGEFYIDRAGTDQNNPAVATNTQDRFLVVWQQGLALPTTDWEIYGRELDITGSPVTPSSSAIAYTPDNETYPDVAINGANNQRMVVWRRYTGSGYAIWQSGWFPPASPLPPFEIAPASNVWALPAIAVGPPGFLSVYEKRQTTSFIYGRMYWEYNLYLSLITKD